MSIKEVKKNILDFMNGRAYAPLNAEDLVTEMHVVGSDLKDFWQSIKELETNGEIIKTRSNTYGLPEKMGLVVGRFQLTSKGFGFVIPDNKGDKEDLFIPPNAVNSAMNNDRVIARIESRATQKKAEGSIIRVVTRANSKIVGVFSPQGEFGFVIPDDKRVGKDIYIASKNFGGAKAKQKVVCEITVWPDDRRSAEGKIIEVLGNLGDVGLEIVSIIKQNNLPLEFPTEVLKSADKVSQTITSSDLKGRRDLRDLSIVTVDGEDAKDLDDAVYVKKQGEDYLLGVYIADVSNYVREDTLLDQEAFERGTSVYLVDRVLPMLPVRLSNGICSLNEGEDRLTMSCEMLIDKTGKVKEYDIFPGIIKSKHRLTYTTVREIVANNNEELKEKYNDIVPMLFEMEELCKILRAKRQRRGSIDFDIPEQKVVLDEKKHPIKIVQRIRSIAESIIEEFMLVANETVAEHMSKQKWPFIYRVHDEPNEGKIENLAKLLFNFKIKLDMSEEKGVTPLDIQRALKQIEGRAEERLISTVALRSLKQAVYQTDNIGHFGLAADFYTHFTSPIRRYPDLIVHRLLRKWMFNPLLKKSERESLAGKLEEIAQHSSIRERLAADAERATVDLKKAEYMLDYIGDEFDGVISGVAAFGFFVELENGIEGLVHISNLVDDYYQFVEEQYCLLGENLKKVYRLGNNVKIQVLGVNIEERTVDFILAGETLATRTYLKQQLDLKRGLSETTGKNQGGAYLSTLKKKEKKGRHSKKTHGKEQYSKKKKGTKRR